MSKDLSVTDAFQKHLAQRRANIIRMFNNPEDAVGISKAEENDDFEEDDDKMKKGCGDGKEIEKENPEETEMENEDSEEDEDEKTDAEKAELIDLIGVEQLDVWKAEIDELATNYDSFNETEKAEKMQAIDTEINGFAEVSGLEKSDILYALSGYDTKFKFRKTGKEIKEQINTAVIPGLNAKLATAKTEAENLLKECGDAPTHDVPEYWTGELHIEMPYKYYEWDETRVPENNPSISVVASFSPDSYKQRCCKNAPASPEEAEMRCKYNEQIRKICNITTDIKACEIVSKNLKDSEGVELNVRQLLAFKFV